MAGKRVDIDIKTTADTSGIKKLDQAVEASGKKAEAAAKKAADAEEKSAKKAADAKIREEKRAADAAEKEARRVARAQEREAQNAKDKIEKEERARNQGVSNMALQLGDVFTQIGGGVDVVRALSQQLPQMMGTSMAGAIAGAAFAAAGPVIEMILQKMQDGMDKASKEALASMKENAKELQKAFGEEAFASQQRALDAIIQQYRTINDETKANIDLNIELANLADERANAADETRIAEIEASKASNPEKQRQILAVRERIQSRAMAGARRAGLGQAQIAESALAAAQGEQYTLGTAAASAREQERIAYDRFRQNRAAAEAFQRVQGAESTLSRMRLSQAGGDVLTPEQEAQRKAAINVIRRDQALAKTFDPLTDPERIKTLGEKYKQARERRIEAETKAATAAEETARIERELNRAKALDAAKARTEAEKSAQMRAQTGIAGGQINQEELKAIASALTGTVSAENAGMPGLPFGLGGILQGAGSNVKGFGLNPADVAKVEFAASQASQDPSQASAARLSAVIDKLLAYLQRTKNDNTEAFRKIAELDKQIDALQNRMKQNTLAK